MPQNVSSMQLLQLNNSFDFLAEPAVLQNQTRPVSATVNSPFVRLHCCDIYFYAYVYSSVDTTAGRGEKNEKKAAGDSASS